MSKERIEIGTVIDIKDAKNSINDLKQSIDSSKSALEGLNAGTDAYNTEVEKLIGSQKQLIGLQDQLIDKSGDLGERTEILTSNLAATTNTVNGMMGGFQALQGILVLTGKENQNLVKTLVKLQAVSSVVQGFRQFTDALKASNMAFRIFNITVRANPLMLLLTSVTAAIGLFQSLKSSISDAGDEIEDFSSKEVKAIIDNHRATKDDTDATNKNTDAKIKNKKQRDAIRETTKDNLKKSEEVLDKLEEEIKLEEELYEQYEKRVVSSETKTLKEIALLKARGATQAEILAAEKRGYEEITKIKKDYNDKLRDETIRLKNEEGNLVLKTNNTINEIKKNAKVEGALWWSVDFSSDGTTEAEKLKKQVYEEYKQAIEDGRNTRDKLIKDRAVVSEDLVENTQKIYESSKELRDREVEEARLANQLEAALIEESAKKKLEEEKKLKNSIVAINSELSDAENAKRIQDAELNKSRLRQEAENRKELLEVINEENEANKQYLEGLKEQLKALPITAINEEDLLRIKEQRVAIINDIIAAEQALNATETESLHLNRERMEIEKEMVLETMLGDLQNKEARLGANDAGKYNSDLIERMAILTESKQFQDQMAVDNIRLVDDETLSWELRLEALYKYNDAMSESYALEAEINAAKLELKEREKLAINSTLQVTANAFMATADLMKEGTAIQKSLAIAGTTISTFAAAQNAYESTVKIPFVGKVLAPIAAGTALLQGIKRVKDIMKVEVPGSKGGNSSNMPKPQVLQPIGNIQETYTNIASDDLDVINNDSRVYVVESDIRDTQNRVNVTESETSF